MSRAAIEERNDLRRAVARHQAEITGLRHTLSATTQERDALSQRLEQMVADIQRARLFAGEHLPAASGLSLVAMLEKTMKGGAL